MDAIDRKIIRILQTNARITNQELAEKINLSPSPCLRRVRALEKSGIIKSYTVEVNNKAYGLPITAFVQVRLDKHTKENVSHFEQSVLSQARVLECFVMTGHADYLLKVLVKDLEDYEHFVRNNLHAIGGVASIDTSFAYATVKKTAVLPDHNINEH